MTEQENRKEVRVPLKLKVAIIYHQHRDVATRPSFHGFTSNISLMGLSVVVDHNIFNEGDVTVLLAIPPEHTGGQQRIVEATAKMIYTVHSSEHDAFRIGMSFKEFKGHGKDVLKKVIIRRVQK